MASDDSLHRAVRSLMQRVENIEERNSDPFGDVKNTLKSMQTFKEHLESELRSMCQTNIDQMSNAAKAMGTWHGQIKDEIYRYCDERNSKLPDAGERIFSRLDALEKASIPSSPREGNTRRIEALELAARSFVSQKRLDELHAKIRRVEESVRGHQKREEDWTEQCRQRIDTLGKTVEETRAWKNRLEKAEGASQKQFRDRGNVATREEKIERRLGRLEEAMKIQAGAQKQGSDSTELVNMLDARVGALENALRQATADNAQREKVENSRDEKTWTAIRRLEQLQHDQSVERCVQETPSSADKTEDLEKKVTHLTERLEKCEKLVDQKFHSLNDLLEENKTTAPNWTAEPTPAVDDADNEHSTPSSDQDVQVLKDRAISKLEQDSILVDVREAIQDLRQRVSNTEHQWLTAAMDAQFESLSKQMTQIRELRNDDQAVKRIGVLTEKIAELERLYEANEKPNDDAAEEHARTSATHHNSTLSNRTDFQARLRKLETRATQQQADATSMEKVVDRMSKLEDQISEIALQQLVDSVTARNVAALGDIASRVGALETDKSNVERDVQTVRGRVRDLEKNSVAATVEQRVETIFGALANVREKQVAANHSQERLKAVEEKLKRLNEGSSGKTDQGDMEGCVADLVARTSRLEDEVRKHDVAHGILDGAVKDLTSRTEDLSARVDERKDASNKLAHDHTALSDRQNDLKEQILDLRDTVDDTRSWITRVSEKSARDDRAILGRMQLCDRELNLRVGHAEERCKGLREDVRVLLTSSSREGGGAVLAEELRRVGVKVEGMGVLDEEAKKQLCELAMLMVSGRVLDVEGALRGEGGQERAGGEGRASGRSSLLRSLAGAAAAHREQDDGGLVHAANAGDVEDSAAQGRWAGDSIKVFSGKRRRGSDSDVEVGASDVSSSTEGMEEGVEEGTPRRSGRAGKGKNRRLA